MATVMIGIDGKTLRFVCEEGDEARMLSLAQKFDSYINRLKAEHGEIGDYRLSIMAGIMALDELKGQTRRLEKTAAERQSLATAHEAALQTAAAKEQTLAQKLDTIAQRIIIAAGKIAPKS